MKTTTYFKALALAIIAPTMLLAQTPQLLKDIATEGFFLNSNPTGFQRAGDNMYFFAAEDGFYANLFISDGTEAGTEEATIDEFSSTFLFPLTLPFGNNILVGNSLGSKIYFSDGTATGEEVIIDDFSNTYDFGFNQKNSFTIGSNLYFWANRTNDAEGAELYKTDGTAAGTSLVKAFNPGTTKGFAGSSVTSHCINATDSKGYVIGYDGDSINLYVSDGTSSGTVQLHSLLPYYITQDPNFYPQIINGHAYIKNTSKVWSVDVSNDELTEIALPVNILIVGTYHMNDKLYIITHDGLANRDLYELSGTTLTLIADDFVNSPGGIYPLAYTTSQCEANGKFYFFSHPGSLNPVQLWVSDGTAAGTVKALDSIGVSGQGMDNIYACNDRTYYFQTGAVLTLFEINSSTHQLEEVVELEYAPYMDEENCRMYFGFTDAVAMYEPHYIDFGAPVNNSLNPPTNLMATTISRSTDKIGLLWEDNSNNETGFYVERGTDGIVFNQIADLGMDVTSYDDTAGLVPGTQYFYRVKAYNATETSNPSNVANATTNILSIDNEFNEVVRMYPNPTSGTIYVESPTVVNYRIYNTSGALQANGNIQSGNHSIQLDLPVGLYFIEIMNETGKESRKLIIQ